MRQPANRARRPEPTRNRFEHDKRVYPSRRPDGLADPRSLPSGAGAADQKKPPVGGPNRPALVPAHAAGPVLHRPDRGGLSHRSDRDALRAGRNRIRLCARLLRHPGESSSSPRAGRISVKSTFSAPSSPFSSPSPWRFWGFNCSPEAAKTGHNTVSSFASRPK